MTARILTGEEAERAKLRHRLWREGREERPCPTCKGVGMLPGDNMWGVTPCMECARLPGVDKKFHEEFRL